MTDPSTDPHTAVPAVPVTPPDAGTAAMGEPETPVLPVAPVTAQFPAVDGTQAGLEQEVAKRSVDGSSGDRYERVITVARLGATQDEALHIANAVGVVQSAMQAGLHARGDVYLVDAVEHDEPLNAAGTRRSQYTELRYSVQVIPASIDTDPQDTTTPTVINQATTPTSVTVTTTDPGPATADTSSTASPVDTSTATGPGSPPSGGDGGVANDVGNAG